jgi:hypothetical protein
MPLNAFESVMMSLETMAPKHNLVFTKLIDVDLQVNMG